MRTLLLSVMLASSPIPWCAPAMAQTAEPQTQSEVETNLRSLLELVGIEGVLAGRAAAFTPQVAILVDSVSDDELAELHAAITAEFDYARLLADVIDELAAEAPDGEIATVLGWLEGGAAAEVRSLAAANVPPESLDDYVAGLPDDPPPAERIDVVGRWVDVQGTGDFFVLLQEALAESAYRIAGVIREDAPTFGRLRGESLTRALEGSRSAAVVRALYRHQAVPAPLIERSIAEYESPYGRWFVENYGVAVAEAVRAAGNRVVARLGGNLTRIPSLLMNQR